MGQEHVEDSTNRVHTDSVHKQTVGNKADNRDGKEEMICMKVLIEFTLRDVTGDKKIII